MVTDPRLVLQAKALAPIEVTEPGMVIDPRLVQL
jgi:hypothetical protein